MAMEIMSIPKTKIHAQISKSFKQIALISNTSRLMRRSVHCLPASLSSPNNCTNLYKSILRDHDDECNNKVKRRKRGIMWSSPRAWWLFHSLCACHRLSIGTCGSEDLVAHWEPVTDSSLRIGVQCTHSSEMPDSTQLYASYAASGWFGIRV